VPSVRWPHTILAVWPANKANKANKFVPALHLSGDYRLGERWSLGLDLDGLAGGPGRLLDASVTLDYAASPHWRIGGGYRTLEGGADTDDVYNFAWLNYALLEVRYLR